MFRYESNVILFFLLSVAWCTHFLWRETIKMMMMMMMFFLKIVLCVIATGQFARSIQKMNGYFNSICCFATIWWNLHSPVYMFTAKCSPVMCLMFCEYGFVQDSNGCDMCKCAPNPCQVILCFFIFWDCHAFVVSFQTEQPSGTLLVWIFHSWSHQHWCSNQTQIVSVQVPTSARI